MPNNNPNYQVIIQQIADPAAKTPTGISVVANLPESFAYDSTSNYDTPYAQGIFGAGANAAAAFTGTRLTTQAQTARIWQGATDSDLMLDLEFFAENDPDADVIQKTLNMLRLTAPTIDPQTGMLRSPGPQLVLNDAGQLTTNLAQSLGASASSIGSAIKKAASNAVGGAASTISPMLGRGTTVQQGALQGQNANRSASGASNTPPQPDAAGTADFWKRQVRNQISIKIGRYAFFDSVVIMNVQKTYIHNLDAITGQPLHAKVSIRFAPLFLMTQDDLVNVFKVKQ